MREKEMEFHRYIYDHYPELLLNYNSKKSQVVIHRKQKQDPYFYKFNSQVLLTNVFKDSTVKYVVRKTDMKIADLFSVVKKDRGSWSTVSGLECYFHPGEKAKYTCDLCCESYCCLENCKRHLPCPKCNEYACSCEKFGCMCQPMYDDT